jgi:hypothetical protein
MLRVIGDVHGQVDFALRKNTRTYLDLLSGCAYSIQVGDMGDAETYAELINSVDAEKHRFFGGNHDHYDSLPPHALGDYGRCQLDGVDFFFVRGAHSSDKQKLVERGKKLGRKLWFAEEELPESQHNTILEAYVACKPRLVLSHTCPAHIVSFIHDFVRSKSRYNISAHPELTPTTRLLERMFEVHQPEAWCFGHYHHDWQYDEEGSDFRCIGELSFLDIACSPDLRISGP